MEGLSYTLVQLIVGDRAPEGRFAVCHRLQVCVSRKVGGQLKINLQEYKLE